MGQKAEYKLSKGPGEKGWHPVLVRREWVYLEARLRPSLGPFSIVRSRSFAFQREAPGLQLASSSPAQRVTSRTDAAFSCSHCRENMCYGLQGSPNRANHRLFVGTLEETPPQRQGDEQVAEGYLEQKWGLLGTDRDPGK